MPRNHEHRHRPPNDLESAPWQPPFWAVYRSLTATNGTACVIEYMIFNPEQSLGERQHAWLSQFRDTS